MRLFTVQPKEVLDIINEKGKFVCDPAKSENLANEYDTAFRYAYKWLIGKMNEKIENPNHVEYPVWAWYKIDGKNELPYFNNSLVNYENQVLLEIEIDDKDVVLTDYNLWHMPLNGCFANMEESDEAWEEKSKWFDSLDPEERHRVRLESWNCVFDTSGKYIQATFWELKKENIVNVYEILESCDLDSVIAYADDEYFTDADREKRGYTKENLYKFLGNYITNNINYNKILRGENNKENLDNLIENNKPEFTEEEIDLIKQIENLYGLDKENIIL